ncbi:MAG: DUF1302 domain-containing protein [Candidatus Omnitrophica bacterium]|nr:DUF1302 domain-containing protein [Candidatus Omnitrophota bacterium]
MLRKSFLVLLLLILTCSSAVAEISKGNLTIAGYLKNETSVGLDTFNEISKFKNILQLSGEYKFNSELAFFMSTKYWYDAVYDWYEKYDTAQLYMGHIQRADWLRDCYLDYVWGQWFLRLGKQQVSWGQADGITILDRLNPVDLTEYWLPDMADIRIPLWMLNINYSPKLNSNLQILIIPDFEQSTAAPPQAPFSFRSYRLFVKAKERIEAAPGSANKLPFGTLGKNYNGTLNTDIYYPSKQFRNSKFGIQWQDRIKDWEYTLNYLYGYDYLARTYLDDVTVQIPPFPANVTFNYSRRFKIVQMLGGSINRSFTQPGLLQGITLRGDAAVYFNEPTYYGDVTSGASRGVNRWDNVFWLMGLDKTFFTDWLVSFQFAQYIMQDAKPGVDNANTGRPYTTMNSYTYGAQDQVENIFSLKVSTDFLNERLKPEILWSFTDDNQGRVSPKITYEIKDDLWLTMGIHYFYGEEQDSNGQFRDNSQFYTMLKFTF